MEADSTCKDMPFEYTMSGQVATAHRSVGKTPLMSAKEEATALVECAITEEKGIA